jgi:phospholipase/carboxylesterase
MMPIAASWRSEMPNTRFVSPDAPYHYAHGAGHQWFGVDGTELRPAKITSVRQSFDKLIGDAVTREGFQDRLSRIAFVGVSQGAIVALDAVASGRWDIGALVTFAGLLPPTRMSKKAKRTEVLLMHGAADTTIPSSATLDAVRRLDAAASP